MDIENEDSIDSTPTLSYIVFQLGSHTIKYGKANGPPSSFPGVIARRNNQPRDREPIHHKETEENDRKTMKILKEVQAEFQISLKQLDVRLVSGDYEKVSLHSFHINFISL